MLSYTGTTKSWQWTTAQVTDCGATKQTITAADANGVKYDYYDIFLNSGSYGANTNNIQLVQMGQIRFRCKLYPFQEDSGVVEVTEDAMVDDDEFKLRLWEHLKLKVQWVDAEDTTAAAAVAAAAGTPPAQNTGKTL